MRELEENLGIPWTIVSEILAEDRGLKVVVAKFVLWLLSQEQKEFRAAVAQDLLKTANNDPHFLKKVIVEDKSWALKPKPILPKGSCLESPHPKKAWQSRSNVKAMWIVFFYHGGVVHHEYAPPGQTITKEYYIKVLLWLRYAVRRKRSQLWASGDWQLHNDSAPAHSSAVVQAFLVKHCIIQVCQPPYNPDFVPCAFWLFQQQKSPLKGRRF